MDLGAAVGLAGSAPAGQAQASERHSADAGSECGAPRHSGGSGAWRGSDASAGTVTVPRSCGAHAEARWWSGAAACAAFLGLPHITRSFLGDLLVL